jgi:hypothetical protein
VVIYTLPFLYGITKGIAIHTLYTLFQNILRTRCSHTVCLATVLCSLIACTHTPRNHYPDTITLAPLSLWQERIFATKTRYSLLEDEPRLENSTTENRTLDGKKHVVIQAHSDRSASMLYQQQTVDLHQTPYLHWQWKVNNIFTGIDEHSKQGDDFAARVYIAVKAKNGSFYPRVLCYVWANHSPKGSHWSSPYSNDTIIIAQQSGHTLVQQWVTEKINVKADLRRYFQEDIDTIEGIAIMTDSDNSQGSAVAFYRDLAFSAQ